MREKQSALIKKGVLWKQRRDANLAKVRLGTRTGFLKDVTSELSPE